jgi:hypothetical protein
VQNLDSLEARRRVVEEVKSAVAVLRKPWSWETHRKLSKFERRRMDEARFRHVGTGFTFDAKPNRKLSSGGQLPPTWIVDSTLSTNAKILLVLHSPTCAPSATCLSQLYSTVHDLFEEVNWSARLWSGCAKKGGFGCALLTTISLFNSRLLLQFGTSGIRSLQRIFTFKFPCTERIFKIASIELHLPSPLCLHLPKKAIRLELSSIWFQECTYLYSIPCISKLVDVRASRLSRLLPCFQR